MQTQALGILQFHSESKSSLFFLNLSHWQQISVSNVYGINHAPKDMIRSFPLILVKFESISEIEGTSVFNFGC